MKNYVLDEVNLNNDCDVLLLKAVIAMLRSIDKAMNDITTGIDRVSM